MIGFWFCRCFCFLCWVAYGGFFVLIVGFFRMGRVIEVLGVYPVIGAEEPCHLLEVAVTGVSDDWDVGGFTQQMEGVDRSNWQVAYDEHFLNEGGTCDLDRKVYYRRPAGPDFRLVFFLHYLDLSKPLLTPFGSVPLPAEQPLPERLAFVEYDPPS